MGFRTMSSNFCYVASVNPSLPSNITYPYGRSIFQNLNFSILIADSGSSQKSSYTNLEDMVLKPKPSTNGIWMSPFGFSNAVDDAAH